MSATGASVKGAPLHANGTRQHPLNAYPNKQLRWSRGPYAKCSSPNPFSILLNTPAERALSWGVKEYTKRVARRDCPDARSLCTSARGGTQVMLVYASVQCMEQRSCGSSTVVALCAAWNGGGLVVSYG